MSIIWPTVSFHATVHAGRSDLHSQVGSDGGVVVGASVVVVVGGGVVKVVGASVVVVGGGVAKVVAVDCSTEVKGANAVAVLVSASPASLSPMSAGVDVDVDVTAVLDDCTSPTAAPASPWSLPVSGRLLVGAEERTAHAIFVPSAACTTTVWPTLSAKLKPEATTNAPSAVPAEPDTHLVVHGSGVSLFFHQWPPAVAQSVPS